MSVLQIIWKEGSASIGMVNTKNAFTKKYNCTLLVYFEEFDTIKDSFKRERQLKAGNRKRKEKLINSINPEWNDLSESWFDGSKESF